MKKNYNEWKQGIFTPNNPKKYVGSHPIVYRSSLELNVMRFFDFNSKVVEWGSESVVIPYIKPTDGKVHKYFTDFNVKIQDNKGNILKYIIEVKPYKQTIPPKNHGNKKPKTLMLEQVTYAVNSAKWNAAEQWCKKHGYVFSKITEKDIIKMKQN